MAATARQAAAAVSRESGFSRPSPEILSRRLQVYKFFSETSNGSGVPGVINNVTVDSGASGNFTIWIQDDSTPNGAPGASDVKQMNLSYGGGTSTVYVLWTSADLGEDDDVTIENLNGPILAGGGSYNTLTAATWDTRANITAVNVVGTVVINDDMTGSIDIGDTLSGTIDISGDVPEASGTHIRIKYLDDGHFECNDLGLLLSGVQGDDWLVVGHGLSDQQATMFGYSTELRSATQGKAGFSMEFARYERAPRDVQEEVIAKAREAKAAKR
jgi:hypothetical protein